MPIAHSNQTSIFYTTDGDPALPALILSNSLGTDYTMWQAQADALSPYFQVIRYDTRGHGRSGCPPGPYRMAQLGADVIAVLDALGIARAHFCGISMGGMIAQWMGLHASGRIDKLVIANSAAKIGSSEGWLARAAAVRADGLDAIADGAGARWFTPAFIARQPGQVASLAAGLRAGNAEGYASCCEALAEADYRDHIHAIPNATLIIAGRDDPVTTEADAQFLQQGIAGAQMAVLPASHISNIEAEAAFTQTLADFLRA
ncbi:Beta-ketoadipate enol-lactone hydrolase [Oxalobacteraceae bacterium IMCC9480]|nr:Beta-ketoadipate enol-lactone hydrolase [Oxalobacteraceae bacterium IMCC9480]NDP58203.1 3-oxoadipate enol-lactonase [Oxalobacteraceae bacterium]